MLLEKNCLSKSSLTWKLGNEGEDIIQKILSLFKNLKCKSAPLKT